MKTDSVSLKRGMIGAILANFAKAAITWIIFTIIYPQRLGYFDNTTTAFMLAISGIASAALAGLGIAWVIRVVNVKIGRSVGVFARAAIGASLLFTFRLLLFSYDKYFPRSNRWSADNPSSWMVASLFYGDWGLTIGSVAGVMARRKKEIDSK